MKSQGANQPARRLENLRQRSGRSNRVAGAAWAICAIVVLASTALWTPAADSPSTRPATSQPASRPATPATLFAHGTADRFWIGVVESSNDSGRTVQKTVLRGQIIPGGQWRELTTIQTPIQGLSHFQGDAVALLDGGSWRRLNGALSTGPTVPGVGPLLAWHAAPKALYAIRDFEGGRTGALDEEESEPSSATQPTIASTAPVTTRPSTLPAPVPATLTPGTGPATKPAAATKPTTRATPNPSTVPSPVFFRYERSQWHAVADLPRGLGSPNPPMQISALGERPVLLVQTEATVLRSFAWMDNRWEDWGSIQIPAGAIFSLQAIPNALALWTSNQDGQMQLHLRTDGQPWAAPKPLLLPGGVMPGDARAFATAGGEFRLVVQKSDKTLHEQRYAFDGEPRMGLAPLPAPISSQPGASAWMFQTLIMVGMVFVILLTLYRRKQEPTPPPAQE